MHGPVEQGAWLQVMGVRERASMICNGSQAQIRAGGTTAATAKEAEEKGTHETERRNRIMKAVERLIERGGGGMGRIYKVMALVPEAGGRRRPVGFGGGVGEGEGEGEG